MIPQYQAVQADDLTIKYDLFKKISSNQNEIQSLLKEGYYIIEDLREVFTKEKIKYVIGTVYRGKLYQTELTLGEIIEQSKISFNTRSKIDNLYKLRLGFKNKSEIKNKAKEASGAVERNVERASTIFSAVWRYFNSQKDNHGKKFNKGNMYQTYKVAVALRQPPPDANNRNDPPITDDQIFKIFNDVKRNVVSFTQGGDLLQEQYKFFSSLPSLITTATARDGLSELSRIFGTFLASGNSMNLFNSLSNFFIKDSNLDIASYQIERDGIKKASQSLQEVFEQLGLT